jgi:hypothetical protein
MDKSTVIRLGECVTVTLLPVTGMFEIKENEATIVLSKEEMRELVCVYLDLIGKHTMRLDLGE